MPTATLTAKGQITLPRAVRDLWGLAPGDLVDFVIDAESGHVELRPLAARARESFGLLYRADRPARSLEEFEEARDAAVTEDDARISRAWSRGDDAEAPPAPGHEDADGPAPGSGSGT